jgi:hypothetical protein
MRDAERITRALKGSWHGRYGTCLCPAHANTRTPALSLSDAGDGRLLAYCHTGCDFQAVLDALRGLHLIEGLGTYDPPSAADLARIRAAEDEQAAKQETRARNVWRESLPIRATIAETYLRGRAITCDLPDTLRFHPDCWHPTGKRFPAMVALIEGAPRLAVHRTYLRPDSSGKADVEPAKAMLGACAGGAVRLTLGKGKLVVAEGIETALSLASGLVRGPVTIWAALSTSGMKGLCLPDPPGLLTVASDGDAPGHAAAHSLATRADAAGWNVSLLPAPEGRDWNDVLALKSQKAVAA